MVIIHLTMTISPLSYFVARKPLSWHSKLAKHMANLQAAIANQLSSLNFLNPWNAGISCPQSLENCHVYQQMHEPRRFRKPCLKPAFQTNFELRKNTRVKSVSSWCPGFWRDQWNRIFHKETYCDCWRHPPSQRVGTYCGYCVALLGPTNCYQSPMTILCCACHLAHFFASESYESHMKKVGDRKKTDFKNYTSIDPR